MGNHSGGQGKLGQARVPVAEEGRGKGAVQLAWEPRSRESRKGRAGHKVKKRTKAQPRGGAGGRAEDPLTTEAAPVVTATSPLPQSRPTESAPGTSQVTLAKEPPGRPDTAVSLGPWAQVSAGRALLSVQL